MRSVQRKCQPYLKKVSSVLQENFNNKFQGCFKMVSMKFFCSRMYLIAATRAEGGLVQKIVKKLSRVFKESAKSVENFNKKFQGCFKNVSMKFCFAIMFSHVSHRSYPSRRGAC